jgi:predicted nucleic-acid-binding Zn-ribbon protein
MSCKMCGSEDQTQFYSEINIHFPEFKSRTETVWAFPPLLICMNCGFTELQIEEAELHQLQSGIEPQGAAA